ncbi:MAG TPA: class I SAM-dependent methyltransferase [Candidatus Angelobacter sp.]|nr:class I SAM-dependent methyltransferase [Candidatus Angelobacter sp.]
MTDTEKIFTRIYSRNHWHSAESRSGPGSTAVRTKRLRLQLNALLRELNIRTLLDIPCGDFNWMRLADLRSIQYTGADIVPELVRKNTLRYRSPRRRFIRADITRGPLPKSDLVLCRDGLIHLSFSDIERAMQTIRESGSTYLLLTTFTDCSRNTDIATGDFRPLNFRRAPFHFPAALRTLADGPMLDGSYPDQVLALYRVRDLPARFEYAARAAAFQRAANRLREGMETILWEARRTYARWRYGLSE